MCVCGCVCIAVPLLLCLLGLWIGKEGAKAGYNFIRSKPHALLSVFVDSKARQIKMKENNRGRERKGEKSLHLKQNQ